MQQHFPGLVEQHRQALFTQAGSEAYSRRPRERALGVAASLGAADRLRFCF